MDSQIADGGGGGDFLGVFRCVGGRVVDGNGVVGVWVGGGVVGLSSVEFKADCGTELGKDVC